ncbi:MAG: glycosyltransferase, partial [Myxococcota bacterium]
CAREKLGLSPDAPVVTSFGQVKAYKNLPALIRLVRATSDLELLIAGKPRNRALGAELVKAAAGCDRIRLELRYIPDDEAQVYLRAADLVALPYRAILNSGSALLALSFDRPVFLPEVELAAELQQMVAPGWVHAGALSVDALQAAVAAARTLPESTDGDHLAPFSPAEVARGHAEAYRALLKI